MYEKEFCFKSVIYKDFHKMQGEQNIKLCHFPLPRAFKSFWIPSLKSGDVFLPKMFAQTILKLSQAAHSVSVRLSIKASSSKISGISASTKVPSISFAVLMLGNFLLFYWNPFEFVLAMAVTKHLINPSSMWKGGRDVFIG